MPPTDSGSRAGDRIRLPYADERAREAMLASRDEIRDALPRFQATFSDRFRVLVEMVDVPYRGEAMTATIPLVETCLDREPSDVDTELLAQLAVFSICPAVPEQIALQIGFGWHIANEHVREFASALTQELGHGWSTDGQLAALDPDGEPYDTRAAQWFRGESWRAPDRARVDRGIALLRRAAAHAPEGMRPPLLFVVGWLLWAIGKRPNALAYLAEASRIEPENRLIVALVEHVASTKPWWVRSNYERRCADQ